MKAFKKSLRENLTQEERILWYHLRDRRFYGFKFRRQHVIQSFIVDFVCLERKLVIELDGGQHGINIEYDQSRDAIIRNEGFRVIRF
jgi:very-short-patch-repair endonuclease